MFIENAITIIIKIGSFHWAGHDDMMEKVDH